MHRYGLKNRCLYRDYHHAGPYSLQASSVVLLQVPEITGSFRRAGYSNPPEFFSKTSTWFFLSMPFYKLLILKLNITLLNIRRRSCHS